MKDKDSEVLYTMVCWLVNVVWKEVTSYLKNKTKPNPEKKGSELEEVNLKANV